MSDTPELEDVAVALNKLSLTGMEERHVDDIITTGSTLSQAIQTIKNSDKHAILCLTLADASLK